MYVLCGRCYEEGSTGSMAEESSVYELEGLEKQLQSLLSCYTSDESQADGKPFCSDFCKLVEEYASRWQVPLPQLRILEIALCYFAQASTFFTSNCDHVLHTLSSLALSVFELLLFFDQKDLNQEPLKHFTVTFQECHLAIARHQNVHLLQVERSIQGGGPWACPALQAILSGSSLPQSEVDGCISSELPIFFELRVRYLLSCERVSEAMALAKCCAWHPTAGQHLFFLQVYLTWLFKTSQHDRLHKEVADFNGKDAVHIICSLECEEEDELLLGLSRAFLSQRLCRGDMYYLCDLVFVWSKLHHRLKTSKQVLLDEIHQLMLSATNVNSIFPFIRAILQEVGEDGIQFCVELCANALESCLPCDVITKSLIYKTIASLLPNDLEVCRACALLVFFLERTVEAYKIVYLLYMHPDQEYQAESSPIRNHVRFEILQVLKKDLYFDPEFWNLIALRTNCLKLMSEKVVSAALEEIMEDKWILNYCTKEPALRSSISICQKGSKGELQAAAKKRQQKEDTDSAPKRLKVGTVKTQHSEKRKGTKGSRPLKNASSEPLRRSFWQLDRLRDNGGYGERRRTTRLSEKNPPKRRIRTPKWLLEDSGTLEENNVPPKIKKHGLKHQKHPHSSVEKRSETGQIKNNGKHRPPVNSHLMARENNSKHEKGFSLDCLQPATPPQVILELSLPDNELMGTFIEETCNRQRGFPQVLLYKPTVKLPATSQPVKTVQGKEVVLRARDASMFVQQLHCYARREKGKGNVSNIQGSVSTITRSSVQGSPPKEKPATEMKGRFACQTPATAEAPEPGFEKVPPVQTTKTNSRKTSSAREPSEKSAVEMKPTVVSQSPEAAKVTESPVLVKIHQAQSTRKVLQTNTRELTVKSAAVIKVADVSQTSAAAEVSEAPVLDSVLQAQAGELCDESAVEMKVTIASQNQTTGKVTQSPGLDKVSKGRTLKDTSKTSSLPQVLQTSPVDRNHMVVTEEIPPFSNVANISKNGAADPVPSQSQDTVLRDEKPLELQSLSSQAEIGSLDSIFEVDVSPKFSEGHVPFDSDTSSGGTVTADPDSINDISALTLVTEMVTELGPETHAHRQPAPEDSASKESRPGSKPKVSHKLHSTSSCSRPKWGACADADVQEKKEGTRDIAPETPENSETVESEESKLEYCCTFCSKVFKGSRVVAHAMFHYRKDECMFCGTVFKDDLLAMVHLSDHIEKLKKSKELADDKDNTKDISTPKTSAKCKAANLGRRSRGRPRKSTICSKSASLPESSPSGSRKLRSNDKPVDGPSSQELKQNLSKHHNCKTPVHKINGHIGKQKELDRPETNALSSEAEQKLTLLESPQRQTSGGAENLRLQENEDIEMDSATSVKVDKESICSNHNKSEKTVTKQDGKVVEEKNGEPHEKICCPVDGCTWFTDLSKNRVALLYHALEDHSGEVRPLELAFRIGNSRCSICMRVLWSFEHFQHHVERHKLAPRHPCLHQGCTARFKTGMEMRRHARRHSPLQAMCCLPGCSQLFICLWALNLHEREHYASKPTKPDKNTIKQTGDKHNMPTGKKQLDHKPKDDASNTVNKTVSIKATCKSRGQTAHNSSTGRHAKTLSSTTVRASLLKQQFKGSSKTKESHVLKNLSNKDTSAQPSGPSLRLRQTLRNFKVANTSLATLKSHKVISSSLLKHNIKVRRKFQKKQVKVNTASSKRRGRPPKPKKAVHDENTTVGQNNETVQVKTDQRRCVELASPSQAAESSNEETSIIVSKSKKSGNKHIKKNHLKQKGASENTSTPIVTANSSNQSASTTSTDKTQKSSAVNVKKLRQGKKRSSLKENGSQTTSSESNKSKKQKVPKCPHKDLECPVSKKPAKPDAVVLPVEAKAAVEVEHPADEEGGKAKAENFFSTQICFSDSVSAVSADSLNETAEPPATSGEKMQKVTTEEKSKKIHMMTKEEKKEKSTDSGKTNKKHRDTNQKQDKKTVKEKQPSKDASKTKTAMSKCADQQVEAKATSAAAESSPGVEGSAEEETTNAALDSSLKEMTSPPTSTTENSQKTTIKDKSQKCQVTKNSDPSKENKKRKVVHKEGDAKTGKKKCKDQGVPSVSKKPALSQTDVQPPSEVKAEVVESSVGEEGKTPVETSQSTAKCPGNSVTVNGQAATQNAKSAVCKDTLAKYGKKPYMRPPPTAYLDERYTTMPKRRKEMSLFQSSQRSPEQEKVATALPRQRCANCFASFNSAEDLQSHLQLQKCSNLFGFDSDDEVNS